jgi:hypothetical protein
MVAGPSKMLDDGNQNARRYIPGDYNQSPILALQAVR